MAKIIKDYKTVTSYSEDYRSGGWSSHQVVAYFCGSCEKEVTSTSKFCSHCGAELKGLDDEIEKRVRKKKRPYKKAIDNLTKIRNEFKSDSLEYKYLSEAIKKAIRDESYIE